MANRNDDSGVTAAEAPRQQDPPSTVVAAAAAAGDGGAADGPAGAGAASRPARSKSKATIHSVSKGKARAVEDHEDYHPSEKWKTLTSWFTSHDLYLHNVGSVARDHLANERTFLAWLRTSLSLASIGVAITQLFRLSSSTYTLPSGNPPSSSTPTSTASSSLSTPTVSTSDLPSVVANLLVMVQQQEQALSALGTSTNRERDRYHKLGKPIGGTFVMLGLLFLFLGSHRYLAVQHHLASKNYFPPARRSILIASFFIGSLLVAAFTSLLVVQ